MEINQCDGCTRQFFTKSFLGDDAAVLGLWHRHAIEQASRRWRGGRRDDSARTRRKILISTQVTPVVQEEEAPSSPKKTLRFSVAPSPVQNEAAKKLRFSVAPSPKKRVSILEEKEETVSLVVVV